MTNEQKQYNNGAWCYSHPTGFVGKDQFGNYYTTCYEGFKKKEKCDLRNTESGGENK